MTLQIRDSYLVGPGALRCAPGNELAGRCDAFKIDHVSNVDGAQLGARAARMLAQTGRVQIASGLTDSEVSPVERELGFRFADDHRAFLQAGLPMDDPGETRPGEDSLWPFRRWPDWRDGDPGELRRLLAWQVEGLLFDVAHNGLWPARWGPRPAGAGEALSAARSHVAKVPQMIPSMDTGTGPPDAARRAIPSCRCSRRTSSSSRPTSLTTLTGSSVTLPAPVPSIPARYPGNWPLSGATSSGTSAVRGCSPSRTDPSSGPRGQGDPAN